MDQPIGESENIFNTKLILSDDIVSQLNQLTADRARWKFYVYLGLDGGCRIFTWPSDCWSKYMAEKKVPHRGKSLYWQPIAETLWILNRIKYVSKAPFSVDPVNTIDFCIKNCNDVSLKRRELARKRTQVRILIARHIRITGPRGNFKQTLLLGPTAYGYNDQFISPDRLSQIKLSPSISHQLKSLKSKRIEWRCQIEMTDNGEIKGNLAAPTDLSIGRMDHLATCEQSGLGHYTMCLSDMDLLWLLDLIRSESEVTLSDDPSKTISFQDGCIRRENLVDIIDQYISNLDQLACPCQLQQDT